jgi:hypothetical protein
MRKVLLVSGLAAGALVLSACGGGSSSPSHPATLTGYVSTIGSSPNVQLGVTLSVTGFNSPEAQRILAASTIQIEMSNPTGGALSNANGDVNTGITYLVNGKTLGQFLDVDKNLYLQVDASNFSALPDVNIPQGELAAVQLFFGQRFFELPIAQLESFLPKHDDSKTKYLKDQAVAGTIIDEVAHVIDSAPHTAIANGYKESGSLVSIDNAIYPTIKSLDPTATPPPVTEAGTYSLTVTTSGSSLTGVTVSVSGPESGHTATATISVAISHPSAAVSAPSGATAITPALIRELESGGL